LEVKEGLDEVSAGAAELAEAGLQCGGVEEIVGFLDDEAAGFVVGGGGEKPQR
jgi:hypothetical protein